MDLAYTYDKVSRVCHALPVPVLLHQISGEVLVQTSSSSFTKQLCVLVLFPAAVTDTLTKATLRRKGLFWFVQVTVHYGRKSQQQELQRTYPIHSEGRKAMSECMITSAQFSSSTLT